MKKSLLAVLLFSLASALLAQPAPPPTVQSITPPSGASSGGTLVTITGANLSVPPNFACFAPCPSRVTFGEVTVDARQESNTSLLVLTPPHEVGTVDVKVTTGDGRSVTIPRGFVYVTTTVDIYQIVLLPIYLETPTRGSNGSLWQTDLWLRNHGTEPVQIAPWPCPADGVCPAVFPLTKTLERNETLHNLLPFFRLPPAIPGRLIYLSRNGAKDVDVQLRIADVSRGALDAGTELPVVREEELKTATAHLLNVPLDSRYRLTLRVYDVTPAPSRFTVRVYGLREDALEELLLTTSLDATTPQSGDFRDLPSYAEIGDLVRQLPAGAARPLRVEVQPNTPGSRFWTFVSVTNNETQHVTTVTPQ